MAYTNETTTSIADLVSKLYTWMASNGWTGEHLDVTTTVGTGGEMAMRRINGSTQLRMAMSWDSANSGTILALYQYYDQNYVIADRPWGQDHDSGNGYAGTTPDSSLDDERHVALAAAPIQYWAFEDDDYTHVVVEVTAGNYVHFGWGMLEKYGDWDGGEYCYGQVENITAISSGLIALDTVSYHLDGHLNDNSSQLRASGTEKLAATIHAEGLPNQTANGMWMVSMGGKTTATPQTTFGDDRQSNDGVSSDVARHMFIDGLRAGAACEGFARHSAGTDVSGHQAMWELAPRYYDDSTGDTYGPMGRVPDVRGMNIKNHVGGDEITQGGDTWVVFPAAKKWSSGAGTSGYLGIAYKKVS